MNSIARRITSASAASLLALTTAGAQSNRASSTEAWRYPGRLLGVYDGGSGRPIEDAEVIDVFNDVTVRTPASGLITLAFLPEGRSLVRIRKVGYAGDTLFISITRRDTAPVTVVLNRLTDLTAVLIKDSAVSHLGPNLRGFEQRRRTGAGYYITEAELRKQDGFKLGTILTRIPGIHVTGLGQIESRGRCRPAIFVDGVQNTAAFDVIQPAPGRRFIPSPGNTQISDFGAVEFYTIGSVPAQFNAIGNACGVLLLWTRER